MDHIPKRKSKNYIGALPPTPAFPQCCASAELLSSKHSWPEPIKGGATGLAVYKQPLQWPAPLQIDFFPKKGKDNHVYPSDGGPSNGLEANNWSDYRTHSQMEVSLGQHRESALPLALLYLWQMPGLTQLKPKAYPDWPANTTGPNTAHRGREIHCRHLD